MLAEHLIDPRMPLRWNHPYPNGMAAHAAVPLTLWRAVTGTLYERAPDIIPIVVTGRIISVLYGTATILLVFLISRALFKDNRPALVAAWIMALGGLHVTQSHFFLADAATIFWFLLGIYLLLLQLDKPEGDYAPYLMGAAFCFGVDFGLKLFFIGMPTLILLALWRPPRIIRLIYSGIFYIAGFGLVTLFSYGFNDLFKSITSQGLASACDCSPWQSLGLYLVELPSLLSFPILILSLAGTALLLSRATQIKPSERLWQILTIICLPLFLYTFLVIFTLDHFLRHLVPFIPWMAISAGWILSRIVERLKTKKIHPALVYAPLLIYLLLFVFDGERLFINDPRNDAANWMYNNSSPGATYSWAVHPGLMDRASVNDPMTGEPLYVIFEMYEANQTLSGYGLKNSFPRDYRKIFDGISQENVDWIQSLFKGSSVYQEVARFKEGYFMPEFLLVDRLLGDRSRNYITEVVIFKRSRD